MRKITYIRGDALRSGEKFIIHGCNSKGKFRSGFAKAVRDMYPGCYEAYMSEFYKNGLHLGNIVVYNDPKTEVTIFNAITQDSFGYDGNQYIDYGAIKTALIRADDATVGGRLAMPKIGAGLGGGDWEIISNLIEECVINNEPYVYLID
jgi:O-acetyl-ADP-ribose deacetylase (regulator of RNase III)